MGCGGQVRCVAGHRVEGGGGAGEAVFGFDGEL